MPLTAKIRTGWDAGGVNAGEVVGVAREEGLEFVAVHGRTRAQQYTGRADWGLLESLSEESSLPLVGNGDLHSSKAVRHRLQKTRMAALMLGRGPLRHPFLFLTSLLEAGEGDPFDSGDYWEVAWRYNVLLEEASFPVRNRLVQMRKIISWFSTGLPGAGAFRGMLFGPSCIKEVLNRSREFFLAARDRGERKSSSLSDEFLTGGHG